MNTKLLTIIFTALAAVFQELNAIILSGCEVPPGPEERGYGLDSAAAEEDVLPPVGPVTQEAAQGILASGVTALVPQAPPVTEATAPPLTGPGNSAPDVTVDVEGIPWDARIHSSGKTFYKSKAANGAPKGAWKLKKGVDAVTVAQIKTELAGGYTAPAGAVTTGNTPGGTTEECKDIYTWAALVESATKAGITPEAMTAACMQFNVPGILELQDQSLLIPAVAKALGLTA